MDENQKTTEVNTAAENNVVIMSGSSIGTKTKFHLSPRLLVTGGLLVMVAVGALFYGHNSGNHDAKLATSPTGIKKTLTAANSTPAKTSQPASSPAPSNTTAAAKPATPAKIPTKTTISVTPTPKPTPWVNNTNCLPQNPSPYATDYVGMTNSQYLQTDAYANTGKLYAALQFAGLLNTVNTKQYVVLAMDDAEWNFTPTQLNWMNASPANMRAVIGWQVVTSCITYDGVNPVKDLPNGATQTVNTLNGPVTFTAGADGLGKFGTSTGDVAIWDWFTSNGSVTVADFVNTSAIP